LHRIRALIVLAVALGAALAIAACGDGGGNDEDPQRVLEETFSNDETIRSGIFQIDLQLDVEGGDQSGSVEAKLGGPFQSEEGKVPQFDVDADVNAAGEGDAADVAFTGGLVSTGEAAYVNYEETDFEVPQELFDQFATSYVQLQGESQGEENQDLLGRLGIDPSNWLTDVSNEGTEDVEGTETIHISGQADVPKLVEDLQAIAENAGSAAQQITPQQLDELTSVFQSADFDIYTGEDDKLLRKLEASIDLDPQAEGSESPSSVTLDLTVTLTDVNQSQTISAPSDAEPLGDLLEQLGVDPGQLRGALRGGLGNRGAPPSTGGPTTPPPGGASQAYLECLADAVGQEAVQQCAELLR
jgi:hypothetical protein